MRLGYACINLTLSGSFRSCIQRSLEANGISFLREIVIHNFERTRSIVKFNIENNIPLYRITSDLVPFGSHQLTDAWEWWNDEELISIAEDVKRLSREHHLRLTIHPGQFNNLSSPASNVVTQTFKDLIYQSKLIELFGGKDLILHVGGRYESKANSIVRFKDHFRNLPDNTKSYLRLENDDKIYTIADVLDICSDLNIKPMYDYHHDICAPSIEIDEIRGGLTRLWGDERIKVHLSSGAQGKADRKHADYISDSTWSDFKRDFGDWDLDVMLEAKKKDLAVLKLQELEMMK